MGFTVEETGYDAEISIKCSVIPGFYKLTLTAADIINQTTSTDVIVEVTSNLSPQIGTYPPTDIYRIGGATTVRPSQPPQDNGYIDSITAYADGFQGTITGDLATGQLIISDAKPAGEFNVQVVVSDNCGAQITTSFRLMVGEVNSCDSPTFAAAVYSETISHNRALIVDINNDKVPDLVGIGFYGEVFFQLGDGAGGFLTPSVLQRGKSAADILSGDFNGDGQPDLAVAHRSNGISLFFSQGGGKFSAPAEIPLGGSVSQLWKGDFNGDGRLDLVTSEGAKQLTMLLGDGKGHFSELNKIALQNQFFQLLFGDFTNDGKTDLIVRETDVKFYSGTGDGTFATPRVIATEGFDSASGDFDGNGTLDLIVLGDKAVTVYKNDGKGNFSPTRTSLPSLGGSMVVVADFNVDGKLDIALMSSVLLGNGAGGFGAPAKLLEDNYIRFAGDFNLDNKPDLAGITSDGKIWVALKACPRPPNTNPTITAASIIALKQGGNTGIFKIATVSDKETIAGNLAIAVDNLPKGISISEIKNDNGSVTANLQATCDSTPTPQNIKISVTDSGGLTASTILPIVVLPNQQPVLGSYSNAELRAGNSTIVVPSKIPSDDGTIQTFSTNVSPPVFTGKITVKTNGLVEIANANPPGDYQIRVNAVDNCGLESFTTFRLLVVLDNEPPKISNVKVKDVQSRSVRLEWDTSELTTSYVQGHTANNTVFSDFAGDQNRTTKHSLLVPLAQSKTKYQLRIIATDEAGNQTISPTIEITTAQFKDVFVRSEKISFSNAFPAGGDTIQASATIENQGDVPVNATVVFYDSDFAQNRREVGRSKLTIYPFAVAGTVASSAPFVVSENSHRVSVEIVETDPGDDLLSNNSASKELFVGAPANRLSINVDPQKTWPGRESIIIANIANTGTQPQKINDVELGNPNWLTLDSALPGKPLLPGQRTQITFRLKVPTVEVGGSIATPVIKRAEIKINQISSPFEIRIFQGSLAKISPRVLDRISGQPIKGAILALEDSPLEWVTGKDGRPIDSQGNPTFIETTSSAQAISVAAKGYQVDRVVVTPSPIENSQRSVKAHLTNVDQNDPAPTDIRLNRRLEIADIQIRQLTSEEIKQRGIDLKDKENFRFFDFSISISTTEKVEIPNIEVSSNGGGLSGGRCNGGWDDPVTGMYRGDNVCAFLEGKFEGKIDSQGSWRGKIIVIPGTVRLLKQFMEVMVFVRNNTDEPMNNVEVALGYPDGLSLPKLGGNEQEKIQKQDAVQPYETKKFDWILRGDKPGFYHLTVTTQGEGLGVSTYESSEFQIVEPQLMVTAKAPKNVAKGEVFSVALTIQNLSPVPVNAVSIEINQGGLTGCQLSGAGVTDIPIINSGEAITVNFNFVSLIDGCVNGTEIRFTQGSIHSAPVSVGSCEEQTKTKPVAVMRGPFVNFLLVEEPKFRDRVSFISDSYDPDDGITDHAGISKVLWTLKPPFGEEVKSSERSPEFTTLAAGLHTVTLEVTDNEGETAIITRTFNVQQRKLLIFVPGTGSSVLIDKSRGGKQAWPALDLCPFPRYFSPDAISLDPNVINLLDPIPSIEPSDVLRAALGCRPRNGEDYGTLLKFLTSEGGYSEYKKTNGVCDGKDLAGNDPLLLVFPWDFRESGALAADKLSSFISCILKEHPGHKVDILAHSQGGLVTRSYLLTPNGKKSVNKFISIGSPWLGAVKAIATLLVGTFWQHDWDEYTGDSFRDLSRYFPGMHELVPSPAYFEMGGTPFVDPEGASFSYSQMKNLLDNLSPKQPGSHNQQYHSREQDNWSDEQSDIQYFHFVGVRNAVDTIGQVVAYKTGDCEGTLTDCKDKVDFDTLPTRGDQTVPLLSASRRNGTQDLNAPSVKNNGRMIFISGALEGDENAQHTGMASSSRVHQLIKQILDQKFNTASQLGKQKQSHQVKSPLITYAQNNAMIIDEEDLPPPAISFYVTIRGTTKVIFRRDNIEKLSSDTPSDVSYLYYGKNGMDIVMPSTNPYEISLVSTGDPIRIEIHRGTDKQLGTIRTVKYRDISLPNGVRLNLITTAQGDVQLFSDDNQDGAYETHIPPTATLIGVATQDKTSPKIEFKVADERDTAIITVTASDNATGVNSIFYSLDGKSFQKYGAPLRLKPILTPVIYAFAEDNAANRSGFYKQVLSHDPIKLLHIVPAALNTGEAKNITIEAFLAPSDTLLPNSVTLLRHNDKDELINNLGQMYDDGTHGDRVAGDKVFTTQIIVKETVPQTIFFKASAAFKGQLKRLISLPETLTVTSSITQPLQRSSPTARGTTARTIAPRQ